PVAVRAVLVRASFAGGSGLEVRPMAPRRHSGSDHLRQGNGGPPTRSAEAEAPASVAHHAAAYGSTTVFFLDDRTAPEGDGFWVWGEREGDLVFTSGAATLDLVLRNGAVPNDVTIRSGGADLRVTLQPGEQRPVAIPVSSPGSPQFVRILTSAGFRPSDVD